VIDRLLSFVKIDDSFLTDCADPHPNHLPLGRKKECSLAPFAGRGLG
jgi:hypothetical protein